MRGPLGHFLCVVGLYPVIARSMGYHFYFRVLKLKGPFSVYSICGVGNKIHYFESFFIR